MRPVVLCFSGLDPSGGAGLQADIEAIGASGAHASIACTAITVQDSQKVYGFTATTANLLKEQALAVLADLPVKAYKSGMLGTLENIKQIKKIITQQPLPYVLDPVLVANSGGALIDTKNSSALVDEQSIIHAFRELLPLATVVTPNSIELRKLSGQDDLQAGAKQLIDWGANAVLVKTAHENLPDIHNTLYAKVNGNITKVYDANIKRLAGEYHGSGCSLASFIAGKLAQEESLAWACEQAQNWLTACLKTADIPHKDGQRIPRRF